MPYTGFDNYIQLSSSKGTPNRRSGGRSAKKTVSKYAVETKHKKNWAEATGEAETAFNNMDNVARINELTFEYTQEAPKSQPLKPQTPKNLKRTAAESELTPSKSGRRAKRKKIGETTLTSSPEDIYEFNDDDMEEEASELAKSSPLRLCSRSATPFEQVATVNGNAATPTATPTKVTKRGRTPKTPKIPETPKTSKGDSVVKKPRKRKSKVKAEAEEEEDDEPMVMEEDKQDDAPAASSSTTSSSNAISETSPVKKVIKTEPEACFICKVLDDKVANCSDANCEKYYHHACLTDRYPHKMKTLPQSNAANVMQPDFICPLHFCLTCHTDRQSDNVYRSIKRRLITCTLCPTAYHNLESCMAAGTSFDDAGKMVTCPEHQENKKRDDHINVSFCFACMKGGQLVCCERCPAAFHSECYEGPVPDGSFYCGACFHRKQLLYGDIVWAKLGSFRWWPGKIIHPKDCPENVYKMRKWVDGQFPVLFFGSKDFNWVDKGRTFLYEEGDSLRQLTRSGNKKMDKHFSLGRSPSLNHILTCNLTSFHFCHA